MVTTFILPGPLDIDITSVCDCVIIQGPGSDECLILSGDNDSLEKLARAIDFKIQGDKQLGEQRL